jgi:hypothetical protein
MSKLKYDQTQWYLRVRLYDRIEFIGKCIPCSSMLIAIDIIGYHILTYVEIHPWCCARFILSKAELAAEAPPVMKGLVHSDDARLERIDALLPLPKDSPVFELQQIPRVPPLPSTCLTICPDPARAWPRGCWRPFPTSTPTCDPQGTQTDEWAFLNEVEHLKMPLKGCYLKPSEASRNFNVNSRRLKPVDSIARSVTQWAHYGRFIRRRLLIPSGISTGCLVGVASRRALERAQGLGARPPSVLHDTVTGNL